MALVYQPSVPTTQGQRAFLIPCGADLPLHRVLTCWRPVVGYILFIKVIVMFMPKSHISFSGSVRFTPSLSKSVSYEIIVMSLFCS